MTLEVSDPSISLRSYYSTALDWEPERLHFAAHSHHLWPNCTRDAQLQAWEDAAHLADEKWGRLFERVIEPAKAFIAQQLGGVDSGQICLGTSTHEFVIRLLSCWEPGASLRVLTTDSEFHSFNRQIQRFAELPQVDVCRVPVEPFDTFESRFRALANSGEFDLVFLSQVFFNSGHAVTDLQRLVWGIPVQSVVVIDGYHAFCALPVSLRGLESRVFYLGGGYKYAQSGEGVCFLYVPVNCELRPMNTGWFSAFDALETAGSNTPVSYGIGGNRFAGATMDFTAAYRFNAVQNWWAQTGITVEAIHMRIERLKTYFCQRIEAAGLKRLRPEQILRSQHALPAGHFVVFQTSEAGSLCADLSQDRIIVDHRADRLRFGFGLYHDFAMIDSLLERISNRY